MTYNKAREEAKWKKWKLEERLLRKYGVSEIIIQELHKYDWALFNSERRFLQRQYTNNDCLNYIENYEMQMPINDSHTLINYLENEKLFTFYNT